MVDTAQLAVAVDTSEVTAATANLNKMSSASGVAEKSLTLFKDSTGRVRNELGQFVKAADIAGKEVLDLQQAAERGIPSAMRAAGTSTSKTTRDLGGFGRQAGQASIQVQQLVGQVQGGVNPMVALSQQAADLGIVLGFPLLGAVSGITAAFAGPFISSLLGAEDATDRVKEAVMSLRDELTKPTEAQTIKALEEETEALQKSLGDLRSPIRDIRNEARDAIGEITGADIGFLTGTRDATDAARERIRQNAILIEQQQESIQESLSKTFETPIPEGQDFALFDFFKQQEELATRAREQAERELEATQQSYQRLLSGAVTQGFSPEQQAAQQLAVRAQQLQQWRDDDLISDEQYKQALLLSEESYQQRVGEIQEQRRQNDLAMQQGTLSATGDFFGNLAQIAEAGGEEQFNTWKRLAQAQAGISAALAILAVYADQTIPTFAKPIFAGAIGGLAAVQVAQIEGQQYSRELGGQVKAGDSVLVGERGPEVVTFGSNGMVTPNSQIGGTPNVEIINNGQPVSAKAQMDGNTMRIILDAAEQRINDNIINGRSTGRAMQGAFGLRRASR